MAASSSPMSTTFTRTRIIDNTAAADQGSELLAQFLEGKAKHSAVSLLTQQKTNEETSTHRLELGKFQKDGNVAEISILAPMIEKHFQQKQKEENNNNNVKNNNKTKSEETLFKALQGKVPLSSREMKPLFSIAENNFCVNFGSFGNPPSIISLCQSLYMTHIIDSDCDNFMRNELFLRIRDVRRALADYISLENEDELFLVDNAAEAMNVLHSSLVFSPTFLKNQWMLKKKKNKKEKREQQQQQTISENDEVPIFRIVMFENQYPMVVETAAFHQNRLNAFCSFFEEQHQNSSSSPPYKLEIVKIKISKEMIESLKTLPVVKKDRKLYEKSKMKNEQQQEEKDADMMMPGNLGFSGSPFESFVVFDEKQVENSSSSSSSSSWKTNCLFVDSVVEQVLSCDASTLIIDHVMFAPAAIIPVDLIAALIKTQNPETLIIVDGAHAIGSIPLDWSQNNGSVIAGSTPSDTPRELCVDAYLSNNHKHLSCPKSSAFLYVKSELHKFLQPSIISNMHAPSKQVSEAHGGNYILDKEAAHIDNLHKSFVWCGTLSHTNFLVIPDVLFFRYRVSSGERATDDERWQRMNRKIVLEGAKKMAEIWKVDTNNNNNSCGGVLLGDSPHLCPAMVCVKFPSDDADLLRRAVTHSTENFSNFIALVLLADSTNTTASTSATEEKDQETTTNQKKCYARVGGNIYTGVEDYIYAAEKFLESFEFVKNNVTEAKWV